MQVNCYSGWVNSQNILHSVNEEHIGQLPMDQPSSDQSSSHHRKVNTAFCFLIFISLEKVNRTCFPEWSDISISIHSSEYRCRTSTTTTTTTTTKTTTALMLDRRPTNKFFSCWTVLFVSNTLLLLYNYMGDLSDTFLNIVFLFRMWAPLNLSCLVPFLPLSPFIRENRTLLGSNLHRI